MSQAIVSGHRYDALYEAGKQAALEIMRDDAADVLDRLMEFLRELNSSRCTPPKHDGDLFQIAYRCIRDAGKERGDESDVKRGVLDKLSKHFEIHEEVWGTHWSGRRIRIDAIVTPLDDSEWKTKSPKLGIEFKNFRGFCPSMDMKDYTKWWAQCHDYAETKFDDHGYVYVFSYNGFSHYRNRMKNETASAFAIRFWGQLGVGELEPGVDGFPAKQSLIFRLQTHKIWSEVKGVCVGKTWSMDRKFGSR